VDAYAALKCRSSTLLQASELSLLQGSEFQNYSYYRLQSYSFRNIDSELLRAGLACERRARRNASLRLAGQLRRLSLHKRLSLHDLRAEDFADFAGEALQGEGFLQEGFLGIGDERGGEGVLSVAGEVEDFGAGTRRQELLDQFVTAKARHHDVGDDEVDGVFVAGDEGEGGVAAGGFENAIAAGGESLADELADGLFVIDEKDSFGAPVAASETGVAPRASTGFVGRAGNKW